MRFVNWTPKRARRKRVSSLTHVDDIEHADGLVLELDPGVFDAVVVEWALALRCSARVTQGRSDFSLQCVLQ